MNKIDAQAEFCNLPEWWDAGFTGKGVNVWNCEGFTDHGKISRKRILQSAPDATVFSGHISSRTANGQYKEVSVMLDDGTGKTIPVPLEEFLTENKIRVLNSSFCPTPFQHPGYKVHPYWKDIIDRYDLCVCCSSGNERKKDRTFDNDGEYLWFVGAVNQGKDGLPVRAGYSNGGEGLDFTDFTGIWNGTSFSSPYLAGKIALILQRWPTLTRQEVYEYIKANCMDLGDSGTDTLYGNGLLIMPEIGEDMEITKTKVLVDGTIKEVKRVMVNNENYIRLRDMDDVLGICKVDYDKARNLPIVKKGVRE